MRVLRRATRRWMIAVAVVALGCATTILIMEERERFARIARQHPGVFPPLASADIAEGLRVVKGFAGRVAPGKQSPGRPGPRSLLMYSANRANASVLSCTPAE